MKPPSDRPPTRPVFCTNTPSLSTQLSHRQKRPGAGRRRGRGGSVGAGWPRGRTHGRPAVGSLPGGSHPAWSRERGEDGAGDPILRLIDAGWRLAWPGASASATLKDFFEPHLFFPATEDESVLIQGLVLQSVKKSKFVVC